MAMQTNPPARRILSSFLGKRCQRGLSSVVLLHNLPKREVGWDMGYRDTRDTRTSPPSLPHLFHAVSLWHIVARGGSRRTTFSSFPSILPAQTYWTEDGILELLAHRAKRIFQGTLLGVQSWVRFCQQ